MPAYTMINGVLTELKTLRITAIVDVPVDEFALANRKAQALGYKDLRAYCNATLPNFLTKLDDELAFAGKKVE